MHEYTIICICIQQKSSVDFVFQKDQQWIYTNKLIISVELLKHFVLLKKIKKGGDFACYKELVQQK